MGTAHHPLTCSAASRALAAQGEAPSSGIRPNSDGGRRLFCFYTRDKWSLAARHSGARARASKLTPPRLTPHPLPTRDIVTRPLRINTKLIDVDHAAHAWQFKSHVCLCACEPIKRHLLLHLPCCPRRWPTRCLVGGRASRSPRHGGRQCGGRAAARSSVAGNVCGSSAAAAATCGNIDESSASLWGGRPARQLHLLQQWQRQEQRRKKRRLL